MNIVTFWNSSFSRPSDTCRAPGSRRGRRAAAARGAYVCMYECVHIYIYIYIYTIQTNTNTNNLCVCTSMHMYVYICVYIYI